jgi:hypothetical protein
MATYIVQQRAEIWYQTEVEAETLEEARDKAWANDVNDGWEQLLDTVEFQDEFYIKTEDDEDWEEFK